MYRFPPRCGSILGAYWYTNVGNACSFLFGTIIVPSLGLFEVREDGSFYMGDYILEDIPQENTAKGEVNEEEEDYMKAKRLKEIHFDIVYHQ